MLEPLITQRTGRCSISASRISQWIGSPGKRACNRANASHASASTPALETFAVLREHMRHRPFVCVAGGFGPMLSTVQDALLVRVMQHMRSASTSLRKVSRDLCNLHAWAAVHRLILTSFRLPPRLLVRCWR